MDRIFSPLSFTTKSLYLLDGTEARHFALPAQRSIQWYRSKSEWVRAGEARWSYTERQKRPRCCGGKDYSHFCFLDVYIYVLEC